MSNALRFKNAAVPKQASEVARLKVVQGPDYGTVYVLTGARISIGRGEENDVVISDLKASRKHAEIYSVGRDWQIKDLGSANGIIVNEVASRQSELKSGDRLGLGETTFEFVTKEAGTKRLLALPKSAGELQSENSALEAQRQRVRALGKPAFPGKAPGKGKSNKTLGLLTLPILGVLLFLLFVDTPTPSKRGRAPAQKLEPPSIMGELIPGASSKESDVFYRLGFREYREGNYLRAKAQFETALQINPSHQLASHYLMSCNQEIQSEVAFHFERGRKGAEAGKLREAKTHFEAVLRLLFRDKGNKIYQETKDQLDKLEKEGGPS